MLVAAMSGILYMGIKTVSMVVNNNAQNVSEPHTCSPSRTASEQETNVSSGTGTTVVTIHKNDAGDRLIQLGMHPFLTPQKLSKFMMRYQSDRQSSSLAEFDLGILKGVSILHFWGTFCPPCRQEMPSLNNIIPFFEAANIRVFCVDVKASVDEVSSYFKENNLNHLRIAECSYESMSSLNLNVVPQTFFVKDGHILGKIEGAFSWSEETARLAIAFLS